MSNISIFKRHTHEQNKLLLATLPQCGVVEYDLPEIDQHQLLLRIEREALQQKGGH